MFFVYLITLICGSISLPLSSLPPLSSEKVPTIADNPISNSTDFLTKIKTNPQQFIAEVQNLDPASIKQILALLEELRASSQTHEDDLLNELTRTKSELDTSNQNLINAEKADTAAAQAASEAAAAHDAAITDDNTKQNAHNLATEAAKEVPSLDDEQKILTDVINMMRGLHDKYADFKVGTCQPSGQYTKDECCVEGYAEIKTPEDCQKALGELPDAASNGDYGGAHDWQARPRGCFSHRDLTFYFNVNANPPNTLHGDDSVICKSVG